MNDSALLTDLYELAMLQAYEDEGLHDIAVFELFVGALPAQRRFLLFAGLEQALNDLEGLRFTLAELDWLRASGRSSPASSTGSPVKRVEAPIGQAQFVESRLLNLIHLSCMIASTAARCVLAAPGRLLVDFGLRRAHGAEAGTLAARASHLAGFAATATVLAGQRHGIPVFGTMAHSYIQAHEGEADAFLRFAASQPGNVTLLIDTYDTEAAARKVVALAPELHERGVRLASVRLDSGDLAAHARAVRAILDAGGRDDVRIFASGNLDEYRIAALLAEGAPIDGFGVGVGTHLTTSADAPSLDAVDKLQRYAGQPRRKRSEGKATWPDTKQVWRGQDAHGRLLRGHVALGTEEKPAAGAIALPQPVMRAGRRLASPPALEILRARASDTLARLPPELRALEAQPAGGAYAVTISAALQRLAVRLDRNAH